MPDSTNQPQHVFVHAAPSNGLGTAGFVVSLVGFLTCGLLSPIGTILSIAGMFREPKGLAIAGFILGLIGCAALAFGGLAFLLALGGATSGSGY